MCQLLGMNSSKPATVGFSFAGFAERGGRTGEHRDGWGIAFHDGDGCQVMTETAASVDSALAQHLKSASPRSRNVVAHIRKATQGPVAPHNSHPFTRTLWGRTWSFAHNGNLVDFDPVPDEQYAALGDTDSERAFCFLLASLRRRFPVRPPSRAALADAVQGLADQVARHGSFNFLMSNGEFLLAHCSTRLHYVLRAYPFQSARLLDCDVQIHFGQHNHLDDRIAVIATEPLTRDEPWQAFAPGQLQLFANGAPLAQGASRELQFAC